MNYPKLPSFRLDGKRALVTGAGRGIGMGASIALAESGANVTLVSRTEKELKDLNPEIINLCKKYFQPKNKKKIFIPQDPNVLSSYYLPNYFVNHSNNPNVINNNGNIITIKNINKDEEITIDYKKYYPSLFKNFKKTNKYKLQFLGSIVLSIFISEQLFKFISS